MFRPAPTRCRAPGVHSEPSHQIFGCGSLSREGRRGAESGALALKFLEGALGMEARERSLREARAASAVSHPNIRRVHEVGESFIVMDSIEAPRPAR